MDSLAPRPLPVNPCCDDDDPAPCRECRDHDEWSAFDDYRWELGPVPDDGLGWDPYDDERWESKPPGLGMAAMVDREVAEYRNWNTDLGDILADHLETLAAEMRALDARTPGQFLDRKDCMTDAARL